MLVGCVSLDFHFWVELKCAFRIEPVNRDSLVAEGSTVAINFKTRPPKCATCQEVHWAHLSPIILTPD